MPFVPGVHNSKGVTEVPWICKLLPGLIRNFSTVAALLIGLLKGKPKHIKVMSTTKVAFTWLKELFTSAPVLKLPDPAKPFVVEVDASVVGLGAVQSQYSETLCKLHPCTTFSQKLNYAECIYDIANCELLVVKVGLEEWRQPFIHHRITDHRNLEYKVTLPQTSAVGSAFPSARRTRKEQIH